METTKKISLPEELVDKLPDDLNAKLKTYYCASCGRFLAYHAIIEGTIIIKCRRCKEYNVLDVRVVEND